METFIILRHPITIMVTAFTKTDNLTNNQLIMYTSSMHHGSAYDDNVFDDNYLCLTAVVRVYNVSVNDASTPAAIIRFVFYALTIVFKFFDQNFRSKQWHSSVLALFVLFWLV